MRPFVVGWVNAIHVRDEDAGGIWVMHPNVGQTVHQAVCCGQNKGGCNKRSTARVIVSIVCGKDAYKVRRRRNLCSEDDAIHWPGNHDRRTTNVVFLL